MRKTKFLLMLALAFLCTNQLFAGLLTLTNRGTASNIAVIAEVSKFPAQTSTGQTLNFPYSISLPSTQTINVPTLAPVGTYYELTNLTFTIDGLTVTFNVSELNTAANSEIHKVYKTVTLGPGEYSFCSVFLSGDGNGNFSFWLGCTT